MANSEYLIPTKKDLVFTADCSYFGSIQGPYKMWHDPINNCVGDSFAISFIDAINDLHEWIKDQKHILEEDPKCKFNIYVMDGTMDKYDEIKQTKVYTISASKAKKYLL